MLYTYQSSNFLWDLGQVSTRKKPSLEWFQFIHFKLYDRNSVIILRERDKILFETESPEKNLSTDFVNKGEWLNVVF